MEDGELPTAPVWWWIVLIVIAGLSFWAQAVVTEERFVPALNLIATEYNIPSDVAGATLMAAGASSPEFISSMVSLFITHSALGLGTIVGSEIFNQLIICAGAVFAAPSGRLLLDRAIVSREVGFYAISILLLYFALQDRRPVDDDDLGEDHIYINFFDACLLFGGYIAYILVCANMTAIEDFVSGRLRRKEPIDIHQDQPQSYGAVEQGARSSNLDLPDMPFLRETFGHEPASNFTTSGKQAELLRTHDGIPLLSERESVPGSSFRSMRESLRKFSDGASLRQFFFSVRSERPSDGHGLLDIEFNPKDGRLSCFLWQRSFFYNMARCRTSGWHLRWFTFTTDQIQSVPNRHNYENHRMIYPRFQHFEFDGKRHIFRIPNATNSKRKEFFFMAPSQEIFDAVVDRMEQLIKHWETATVEDDGVSLLTEAVLDGDFDDFENSDPHVDLTEFPVDGSNLEILCFFVLFPLLFLMQWTIGDVRTLDQKGNPTATLRKTYLAILMCLVWLVVGSYAMVSSLEHLAALLDIPDSVVGVTVSAAGSSLPNYVASKVAAQKGLGNMAVSNAFGSNTFNIMVGLGLPWLLYIASTGMRPYHGLRDDGITASVVILGSLLAVFLVLVVPTGFVLYRWHGTLFICLYIVYIAYSIGQVYL